MSQQDRARILQSLQERLDSPVLAYVTGDRPGLETQISGDQVVRFPRHLSKLGDHEWINLLVYTRGGDTTAVWPVLGFLREHAKKVRLLIPYIAHSSGTLLALGGDEIVMTRYATLSPIDPTVANPYNALDPANNANRLPIAVEDVLAFMEFATSTSPDLAADAFRKLSENVHPLALGNVQRSINMIRELAKKIIGTTSVKISDAEVGPLIKRLTTEYYTHQHLIGRTEAASIGLPIETKSADVEDLLWSYYQQLSADLELLDRFDPPGLLRAVTVPSAPVAPGATPAAQVQFKALRAVIETVETCDEFVSEGVVTMQAVGAPMPQQMIAVEMLHEGWSTAG